MISFQLGPRTVVQVWPAGRYLQTVYSDSTTVPAAPQDNEEYRARARELGYGEDTWSMCVEHELLHTLLALSQGRVVSPTLWAVAHGTVAIEDHAMIAAEESAVLEFQRKLNECRSR